MSLHNVKSIYFGHLKLFTIESFKSQLETLCGLIIV